MSERTEQLLKLLREKKRPRDEQGKFRAESIADIAQEYGIDPNDVMVRALSLQAFDNPQEKRAAVLETGAKMHFHKPTDADAPSVPARRPAPQNSQERLMQEYIAGSKSLYGNQLIKFKQRMREKGLEIS